MRALRAAWVVALMPVLCAQTAPLRDLLAAPRQRIETADYRVSGHLVRVQANGVRTSFPITIEAHWFPGVLRVLAEVGDVQKDAGTTLLPDNRAVTHALIEMRPDGQNAIWVAHPGDKEPVALPLDKWNDGPLGSGLSYEDFLEQQYFWPGQTAEGEAKFGARDCEVVESTSGPADKTHYSAVKTWLDRAIGFPVYIEKTVKETGAVKEFTYFGLRHDKGIWSAHQIEVKTRGQAGSTLLIIDRGSANARLGIADFSLAQLTRF